MNEIYHGNGDGTFSAPILFPAANAYPNGAIGDFDGDGRLDIAVPNTSQLSIFLGGAAPDLTISASHGSGLTQGQQGAEYALTVYNAGDFATVSPVGVITNLPANVTATGIAGTGWTCALATLACTRSDTLAQGASYPIIYVRFNIQPGATGNFTSSFTVGGGREANTANDYASDTTLLRTPSSIAIASSPTHPRWGNRLP